MRRSSGQGRHAEDGMGEEQQAAEHDPARFAELTIKSDGLAVDDSDDDDPVLVSNGEHVDTWREGYPYDERMSREQYEKEKRLLQIELLKLQNWVKASGEKIVILFEGRDA